MSPLLSVAIPTHNRSQYAVHAIRAVLSVADPRLEVVVSDTSTDGELARLLRSGDSPLIGDARLKYLQPTESLDMTGNHEAAIARATGEYVCLIGDDDTMVPDALNAAAWALQEGIDLVAPSVVANYAWPDFQHRYFGMRHGSRLYFSKSMGAIAWRDSHEALAAALRRACQGTDGLPKIYHGIVRRSMLERLREMTGAYFHGSSPDVSGAIGLAACSRSFVAIDYPLTIPGASGGSNTGRSAMNRHRGSLSQESQTRRFEASGWSPGVPRFFSVETVWAHAALETLSRVSSVRLIEFNFARLIAICTVLHADYRSEIAHASDEAMELLRVSRAMFRRDVRNEVRRYLVESTVRTLSRARRPTASGGRAFVAGLDTIAAAPAALTRHMAARGLRLEQVTSRLSPICSASPQLGDPPRPGQPEAP